MKRQTKKVNLDVPKGVESGMTMKMTGQGVEAAVGNAVGKTLYCCCFSCASNWLWMNVHSHIRSVVLITFYNINLMFSVSLHPH